MARPKVYEEPRVATAVRLPEELHQRLKNAADDRDVSVNRLVIRALDEYLSRLKSAEEDIRTVA
jgi:predicted HicB family RNase H-like nuclease